MTGLGSSAVDVSQSVMSEVDNSLFDPAVMALLGLPREEIVEIFVCHLEEADKLMDDLEQAIAARSAEISANILHQLKAQWGAFGAQPLVTLCATLEARTKLGRAPEASDLEQLRALDGRVRSALQEYIQA